MTGYGLSMYLLALETIFIGSFKKQKNPKDGPNTVILCCKFYSYRYKNKPKQISKNPAFVYIV